MFGLGNLQVAAIGAVAGIALLVGAYTAGIRHQARIDAVADLKAQIETLKLDAKLAQQKATEAQAQAEELEATDAANQEKIRQAEAVLAAGYGCPDPAVVRWLLDIGKAGPTTLPPAASGIREAGASAATQGCDPWPIIAARERAGRLKANDIIGKVRVWYEGLRADLAAGRVTKPLATKLNPQ